MTRRILVILASAGSAALLLGALGFQYIGDLPPCKMCYWQRYPHGVAVLAGIVFLAWRSPFLILLGAMAALATACIGFYHAGVEQGWWEGPDSCTSGSVSGLSTDELLAQIMSAPLVRCDEIPWEFLSLSMAGWNAVLSFALALIWLQALRSN